MEDQILDLKNIESRQAIIKANSILITQLRNRLKAKRFRSVESDNIKQGYIRLLIQALKCQSDVLGALEVELLRQEVSELKEMIVNDSGKCEKGNIRHIVYDETEGN
jgi:hypothetical protein